DPNRGGNHRKNLRLSLQTSLRRLRTDYLDVLWVHIWDQHTPVEETMRALDDEVRAGRVLYIGVSDAPAWVVFARQHAGGMAELDPVRRSAGALQPRAARHRTRAAADGRRLRDDGGRLEPAGRWPAVGQVHPARRHGGRNPARPGRTQCEAALKLNDNLAAAGLELPPEVVARLDDATDFEVGFPTAFIAETRPWVLGAAADVTA
ncbi:MAG TPA: aldo/keto reductase, partial [Kineosporiaceae bacterium]|nr:aldo/keto reductase [Kineosporiaceae bacterium]